MPQDGQINIVLVFSNLHKCDFTLTGVTVDVSNGHFSVVFNPALATQDVMNA